MIDALTIFLVLGFIMNPASGRQGQERLSRHRGDLILQTSESTHICEHQWLFPWSKTTYKCHQYFYDTKSSKILNQL